mmetsp:Transcript_5232/g.13144  ORF Transcript_5232/g.13144 Transcript_5232/m.13144 type:complete len:104 (+) Transcript_5232:1557-1868(+)
MVLSILVLTTIEKAENENKKKYRNNDCKKENKRYQFTHSIHNDCAWFLSLFLSLSLMHTHTLSLTRSHALTHSLTCTHSLTLRLTLTTTRRKGHRMHRVQMST